MKTNSLSLLLITVMAVLVMGLSSCEGSSSSPVTYDVTDATIYNFYFADNDSFPGLGEATFIVDDRIDTGLIYMEEGDSIRFGTPLDSVTPRIIFNSVPSAAIFYVGDTSFIMTGSDTLDFTQTPLYVRVYANDRVHEKWYRIEPRVHQIDPYLYQWEELNNQICTGSAEQQVILKNGTMYLYRNNGMENTLYTSEDGKVWQQQSVTGLPTTTHPKRMVMDNVTRQICYADTTGIYTSTDGSTFEAAYVNLLPQDCKMKCWMVAFDNKVWGVMENRTKRTHSLVYCTLQGGAASVTLTEFTTLGGEFPISDFAATTFESSSGLMHALIAGGYNEDGKILNGMYSIEKYDNTYRLTNVASRQSTAFAGAAIVKYGDKLLWFGGRDEDGVLQDEVLYSLNEGLTWKSADTAWHILPANYEARQRICVLEHNNNLYLVGGESATQCHTDVYKGRMNSIDW